MTFATSAAQETVDDIFNEFGRSAVYTPPAGSPEPCLIIVDLRDIGARPDDGKPIAGQITIEVRKSDLAAPVQNGTFDFDADTAAVVMNRPQTDDEEGLIWKMWAR
jgi:hypothetical protein